MKHNDFQALLRVNQVVMVVLAHIELHPVNFARELAALGGAPSSAPPSAKGCGA
jgi:hypothetical protein